MTISSYFYLYTLAEYTLSESAFYFRSSASCGVIRVGWGVYQSGAVVRSSIGSCPELYGFSVRALWGGDASA